MKDNKNSENNMQYLPIGMCIGISIGTAIGAATDNIGVGMCLAMKVIGNGSALMMALGIIIGCVLSKMFEKLKLN